MTQKKKPAKKPVGRYVAVVGITTAKARYEPGDPVPESLVKDADWLVSQGKVEKAS
jgi:hypothetical protein